MKDMIPFLIVLLAALTGFSISSMALKDSSEDNFILAVSTKYRVMFGDFDTDSYNDDPQLYARWILFICATTLLGLVMLNMLVAVMSDTYARVMNEVIPKDYSELNSMILE